MAVPTDITAGTITLTNGSVDFTGTGTGWVASDIREGDIIAYVEGGEDFAPPIIATITSNTAGTLIAPWQGPTLTGVPYRIRYQWDSSRVSAQARQLIDLLGNGNITAFSGLTGPGIPVFNGPHSMIIKPESDFVQGITFDVQVDEMSDRDFYDSQLTGFKVLVSDTGDGRAALFTKNSDSVGDWSDPAYITGDAYVLTVNPAVVGDFGTDPSVVQTPNAGGSEITFTLPQNAEFFPGTITTGAPGSSASLTPVAVAGGYRLDGSIPKGDTGDINGVTPFWVTRLSTDTNASEARDGLEVTIPYPTSAPLDSDFNEFIDQGWVPILMRSASGGPYAATAPVTDAYFFVHNIRFASSNAMVQVAYPYLNSNNIWFRVRNVSSVWGVWRSLIDTYFLSNNWVRFNYGTASGPALAPIHVGNSNVNDSVDTQVLISRNVTGTSGNGHAFADSSQINRSGDIGYNSFNAVPTFIGSNGYDHYAAFQAAPSYNSTGLMTRAAYNYSSQLFIGAGASVNEYYGAWIANPVGAGTLNNAYGVYVQNLNKGGTNNYAFYADGSTPSRLGGRIGIGADPILNAEILVKSASARLLLQNSTDTGAGAGLQVSNIGEFSYIWQYNNRPIIVATNNTERLRVAGNGLVTMAQGLTVTGATTLNGVVTSSQYATLALQPTVQVVGPSSGFSTSASRIPFNGTPSVNRGGHWNTTTNLWTCPVAGNYLVLFDTEYDGSVTSTLNIQIRRNGSNFRSTFATSGNSSGKRYENVALTAIVPCSVADTIDMYLVSGYVESASYTGLSITLLN